MRKKMLAKFAFWAMLALMISADHGFVACQELVLKQRRVALVIGNSDYAQDELANTPNDAKAISRSFSSLGFEVTTKFDRNKSEIETDLDEITDGLKKGDALFFFYAGHGVQAKGSNFLVPAGATVTDETHVLRRCVSVDYVLAALEYCEASVKVVMLDAGRDSSFRNATREKIKGLATVEAPVGTLVAFSSAPNAALNESNDETSMFTKYLLKVLSAKQIEGMEIKAMFDIVAGAVNKTTGQRTFVGSDASMNEFYLRPGPDNMKPKVASAASTRAMTPDNAERTALESYAGVTDVELLRKHAEAGIAKAQTRLGDVHAAGILVATDGTEALKWYRVAAEQGNSNAQVGLGILYSNGRDVPTDYARAYSWYSKAAAQGNANAYACIGEMYFNGHGVKQSFGQAIKWFRRATAQKDPKGMYFLGMMHQLALGGVDRDYAEGEKWMRKATLLGFSPSKVELDKYRKLSNDDQMARKPLQHPIGMKFKLIPAGTFQMGSETSEQSRGDEEERHRVTIPKPFYMSMHEITIGQYRKFSDATGYRTKGERSGFGYLGVDPLGKEEPREQVPSITWKSPGYPVTDDHPAVQLSWDDAVVFANWLSTIDRSRKYRLPTEAEWEYAARGGSSTTFATGNEFQSLKGFANVRQQDGFENYAGSAPVGSFKPNNFGLHDMHGNVWEWCLDSFDPDAYYQGSVTDPLSRLATDLRLLRGGCFM